HVGGTDALAEKGEAWVGALQRLGRDQVAHRCHAEWRGQLRPGFPCQITPADPRQVRLPGLFPAQCCAPSWKTLTCSGSIVTRIGVPAGCIIPFIERRASFCPFTRATCST